MLAMLVLGAAVALQEGDPPAPPPQEPPRSKALEDLLRRLAEERGAPSVVPPSPREAPVPAAEGSPLPPAERAILRRASDSVQVVLANGLRRDLQYWDASLELGAGDEVRQGSHSCAVLEFPEGARIRVDGVAKWRMKSDVRTSPRLLEFVELGRVAVLHLGEGGIDTVVVLPGGTELAGRGARVVVRDRDQRALEIRNSGPEPVVTRNPYVGAGVITLPAGQRVFLPVRPEPAAQVAHLTHDAVLFDANRGRLVVQAPDEIALTAAADAIELAGRGPVTGVARACGARLVLAPGATIRLTRAPLGWPRPREWEE